MKRFMFKSFFFSNEKEKKVFFIYLTVIALVTLTVSLIIILVSMPKQAPSQKSENLSQEKKQIADPNKPRIDDFIIPDGWISIHDSQFHTFRQELGSWSIEQINEYWISPRKISIEILEQQNDKYIKELFKPIQ